jgi:hypothetical protein
MMSKKAQILEKLKVRNISQEVKHKLVKNYLTNTKNKNHNVSEKSAKS